MHYWRGLNALFPAFLLGLVLSQNSCFLPLFINLGVVQRQKCLPSTWRWSGQHNSKCRGRFRPYAKIITVVLSSFRSILYKETPLYTSETKRKYVKLERKGFLSLEIDDNNSLIDRRIWTINFIFAARKRGLSSCPRAKINELFGSCFTVLWRITDYFVFCNAITLWAFSNNWHWLSTGWIFSVNCAIILR